MSRPKQREPQRGQPGDRGPKAQVCVAGELLWDHHADGPLESARRLRRVIGGAAANVSLALAAQKIDVAVAGVVGDDPLGRGIAATLEGSGVDVSALAQRPGQTGSVFIEPQRDGEQRFYSYRPSVTWPRSPKLPSSWRRGTLRGCLFHVCAVNPDDVDVMEGMCRRVVERGGVVTIDVNARPRPWRGVRMTRARRATMAALFSWATWLKASEDDLKVLGLEATRSSLGLNADATLLVTRGARAIGIQTPEAAARVSPPKVKVGWSVGAGDRFSAALIAHVVAHQMPSTTGAWKVAVTAASTAAARYLQRASPK